MGETVIKLENVGMEYKLNREKVDNLKEYVIKFIKRELKFQSFWALKNISFELEKGDKVGIIGLNGAGKSTLLKLIAGVMKPKEGNLFVKGTISPLLTIGAGFDPEYTGIENIFLNGALLGYTKQFLEGKSDEIIDFSEIGDFIDIPLKNYSSGMRARLGFSIATFVEPEILIIDEVLSVGDAKFQQKSMKKMKSLLKSETTVLFVSHSIDQVKKLCNRAIWLEKGQLVMQGPVDKVCDSYIEKVNIKSAARKTSEIKKVNETANNQKTSKSSSIEIVAPKIIDPTNNTINDYDDKIINITFNEPVKWGTRDIELVAKDFPISFLSNLSDDGKTLYIKPKKILADNNTYQLILHTGCVIDKGGNNLIGTIKTFKTGK